MSVSRACCGVRKIFVLIALIGLLLLGLWRRYMSPMQPLGAYVQQPTTIVWWTMTTIKYETFRICDTYICQFSSNRNKAAIAQALLFYGSDMDMSDMPLPRAPQHSWALLHEESPRNRPYLRNTAVLQHFNYTSTFSEHSDQPLTTYYLPSLEMLTSAKYMAPVGQKTLYRSIEGLAPIAFLQSDCDAMNGRDEYVRQLMQYIAVDSYGQCLHNRDLPKSLRDDYLNKLYSPQLLHLLGKYKFIIAYENGVCDDYITEKFWRPLIVGAVPIYFGAPTIRNWEPNPQSVIHIADFDSPKALAAFVASLDHNDTAYNAYLDHKYDQLRPISNRRLLKELGTRLISMQHKEDNLFDAFECYVCQQLHMQQHPAARGERQQQRTATEAVYRCPLPVPYPRMDKTQLDSQWQGIMVTGQCQALVLDSFWQRNINYTNNDFNNALAQAFQTNRCK